VLVRAFDRRQVMALDGVDVKLIVRELFESAVLMGREALEVVGIDAAEVDRVEAEYRRRDLDRLELQSKSGDLHVAKDMMFRPGRPLEPASEL
jgi:glutathione-regulated potassium-efflux system protein KefB